MTIASNKAVDYERVARETAREMGYVDHSVGMDAASEDLCQVLVRITQHLQTSRRELTKARDYI